MSQDLRTKCDGCGIFVEEPPESWAQMDVTLPGLDENGRVNLLVADDHTVIDLCPVCKAKSVAQVVKLAEVMREGEAE